MATEEKTSIPSTEPSSGQLEAEQLVLALDASAAASGLSQSERTRSQAVMAQRLASERLGMVGALFTALGCKHPATAAHSLRVALGCSRWAHAIGMPEKLRLQLEAAALLHDIGKLSVPDAILTKPARLTPPELRAIDHSSEAARQILTAAQAPKQIVDGVSCTLAWYDGTHRTIKTKGEDAPYISRMIAIVDAYDSMTTDQVYRPAMAIDRAITILFDNAGTQFDPGLVASFAESLLKATPQTENEQSTEECWLTNLGTTIPAAPVWNPSLGEAASEPAEESTGPNFAANLIAEIHDAVIGVDDQLRVTYWNTAAARITGIGHDAAIGATFSPAMIGLSREDGEVLPEAECPLRLAIDTGLQSIERMSAVAANGRHISLDLHAIPMRNESDLTGAALVLHDASSEASLERRCRSLHMENAKDPLTKVANRAEFDRMLATFVEVHDEIGLPFSLIMADIDRFKSINDTYGHQSGDEAIIEFASLLKSMCRAGDLVARYGGEEFAILCADCNTATAYKRADQIRERLASITHNFLDESSFTASFGVTELQVGDTPESILRRADRALLQAKDQGRNQVVQLGNGMNTPIDSKDTKSWFGGGGWWFSLGKQGKDLINTRLVTNVPIEMAVEKLKGFIADRDALIVSADKNRLSLEVEDQDPTKDRRSDTKPAVFIIEMKLSQEHIEMSNSSGFASGAYAHTFIEVNVRTKHAKRAKASELLHRAQLMIGNLKSYIMARDADEKASEYTASYTGVGEATHASESEA